MKQYFDCEFSGLQNGTTLISIGIVIENGNEFYAEFLDYDKNQITDWIRENVISKTMMFKDKIKSNYLKAVDKNMTVIGDTQFVKEKLLLWLSKYKNVKFYSDVLAYDWVLLQGLIADYKDGYPKLPSNVYYIPFDLATYFEMNGIDPDINREEYCDYKDDSDKHNALHDAKVIKKCFEKLNNK